MPDRLAVVMSLPAGGALGGLDQADQLIHEVLQPSFLKIVF